MQREIGTDIQNPQVRNQFLRDNCDAVEPKGYMKGYTPEELDTMKTELSEVSIKINDVEEEKKEVMKGYKELLDPLADEKKELLRGLKEKAIFVKEDCFKFVDQEERMTGYYNQEGILVESRPSTADELQSTVFQELRRTGTN